MRTLLVPIFLTMTAIGFAADPGPAAHAVNELGLDLHRRFAAATHENLFLAPYSIQMRWR
jgi:hypothetical protein